MVLMKQAVANYKTLMPERSDVKERRSETQYVFEHSEQMQSIIDEARLSWTNSGHSK